MDQEGMHRHVKPDRNGPCWCGSGKKYKKCHLAEDEAAERAPNQGIPGGLDTVPAPLYRTLMHRLFDTIHEVRSRAEMREAHRLYLDQEPEEFEMQDPFVNHFYDWAIIHHRPGGTGRTIVEEYIRRRPRLPANEAALLESLRASRMLLFEVQRIEIGTGLEVKDLFAGTQFFIHDVTSSRRSAQWDCSFCRIMQVEGRWQIAGDGYQVPRALLAPLTAKIESASRAAGLSPADYVHRFGHRLHRLLHEVHQELLAGLAMVNAEGDPLEFWAASYEVGDVGRAAASLAAAKALKEATSEGESTGVRTFAWAEQAMAPPQRVYGHIEIRNGRLRLECNSRRRLAIGRQLIEKHAGAFLQHEGDSVLTLDEVKDRVKRQEPEPAPKSTGIPPELERELMLRYKTAHYAKWPDERLPALNGQTPREAVRSVAGRRAVETLIRDFENHEAREGGLLAFDFSELRKTLGLSDAGR